MNDKTTGRRMANLVNLFRRPKPAVGTTPADVVFRENKWRLLRYRPRARGPAYSTPLLLVPSIINRHYVLDLMKGKSFVEYMVEQGHEVYIIDWGTPGPEDRYLTFDDVCDRYIGRAVRFVARRSAAGAVHLLGYCLGGTLTTIYTAVNPKRVSTLIALAAPVSFADDGLLSAWTKTATFDVQTLAEATGNVPWQLMQAAFHLLRPTLTLSKLTHVIDRAWDDEFLDGFMALETWGNDNVSFPGAFYVRYINDLYRNDALMKGKFLLSDKRVQLEKIVCPTLVITFEHDNIVPPESATVLAEAVGATDKQHLHLCGGHVGAVVSRKASGRLWPQISEWMAQRDGAST